MSKVAAENDGKNNKYEFAIYNGPVKVYCNVKMLDEDL